MIGLFWNIRGMGLPGRIPALVSKIRSNHVDFVGVMETKKTTFTSGFLRSLTGNIPFEWHFLPAIGSAGGILVGANSELFSVTVGDIQKYSVSAFLQDRKIGFNWRLVVVYGSPYEEGKQDFLEELHKVMLSWQGPTLFGGDFNLVRSSRDKNNGNINHKWADAFKGWINCWGIIEINSSNKMYTWTNNQDTPVLAKLDRIIATTDWEANFPCLKLKL
jgi:hypothetical protein